MPTEHTIRQGECILSIATRYGHKWETIWDAPGNKDLRKERSHPGVLLPGDRISIPDLKLKTVSLATGERHTLKVTRNLVTVRIRLMEPPPLAKEDPAGTRASRDQKTVTVEDPEPPKAAPDEPRKSVPWEVQVDGAKVASGKSDGDGYIEFQVSPDVTEAELIVEPGAPKELRVPLALGGLDPVTTVSGVKQRLYNLGFDCGDTSQDAHENFAAVVAAFQQAQGIDPTGELDDGTRDRLKKVHGL
jgi:hypothetical protein